MKKERRTVSLLGTRSDSVPMQFGKERIGSERSLALGVGSWDLVSFVPVYPVPMLRDGWHLREDACQ
jgi:hypothetical protein